MTKFFYVDVTQWSILNPKIIFSINDILEKIWIIIMKIGQKLQFTFKASKLLRGRTGVPFSGKQNQPKK